MELQAMRQGPGSQCLSPLRCLNLDDNERRDGHKDDQKDKGCLAQNAIPLNRACTFSFRLDGLSSLPPVMT